MGKLFCLIFFILSNLPMVAQDAAIPPAGESDGTSLELPATQVEMEFEDQSFFVESPATSIVVLPGKVENPLVKLIDPVNFQLLDYRMVPASGDDVAKLEVHWFAIREGLQTFPSIEVTTGTGTYSTSPSQIFIGTSERSETISLEFKPAKTTVYVGEPLRVDVVWKAKVSTKRIRDLECYPSIFNNPQLELTIPRSTDPEPNQIGLPFGGRRIIARRDADPDNPQALGTITFPIYIKFKEPGPQMLDRARLHCAHLQQDGGPLAPYAAYYNNGLFEDVDKGKAYQKIHTDSEPISIEVIPLPEDGRTESFSGMFLPCTITSSITPTNGIVGQIMTLDIKVTSPVPSDFLELPSLSRQKGFRSLFKIGSDFGRTWREDGAHFTTRLRALSTRVRAIPPLEFQVFDPQSGVYSTIQTASLPITLMPQDGKDYFDSKILLDTKTSLTSHDEGIWHNREIRTIHNLIDTTLGVVASYFWLFLTLGPLLFFILLPRILEYRKREQNPVYRKQIDAYRKFQKLPEGDIRKWNALKELIAISLGAEPGSWTIGDSGDKLRSAGCDEAIIQKICECHEIVDSKAFSTGEPKRKLPLLKPVGQSLFNLLSRLSIVLILSWIMAAPDSHAEDWDIATRTFDSAMEMEPGTTEYHSGLSEAALKFETVARSGKHPGLAWYNAGNAWFFAGEVGRSIAAYKHAQVHRPLDPLVKENLTAARALAIDVVESRNLPFWLNWPVRWSAFLLIVSNFLFWGALLFYFRHHNRRLLTVTATALALILLFGCLSLYHTLWRNQPGVVIVTEVFARKGPGYNYPSAFHEPLHDGLEFELIESRDNWLNIKLTDGRSCWIPESQAELIDMSI